MLKIKDNSKLKDIIKKYNFEYDADSDYEGGWYYAIYMKDRIVFDVTEAIYENNYETEFDKQNTVKIYGIDNSKLDILYDLIKADLVEKVDDK